jgi:hypothetical protein
MGLPVLCATFTLRRGVFGHFNLFRDKSVRAPGMHAAFVHPWPINFWVFPLAQSCGSVSGLENAL